MNSINNINPLNPSYPETAYAISEQIKAFLLGRKRAILLVMGNAEPLLPDYVLRTETPIGTFFHRDDLSSEDIGRLVTLGLHGVILGYVSVKSSETTEVVLVRGEGGKEVQVALCCPRDVELQKKTFAAMYPEHTIEVGDESLAISVIKQRIECFKS